MEPAEPAEPTGDDLPSPEFLQGVKEFNAKQFFDCHETLEAVWKKETSPRREFTQGVIQTAVAYYHLGRDNQVGAIKLFHRALPRLRKFAPCCYGVNVDSLAQSVNDALSALENCTPDAEQRLLIPPVIEMTL